MNLFWPAIAVLPFIAALQRFAISYGYRRMARADALVEAVRVGSIMAIVCAGLAIVDLIQ